MQEISSETVAGGGGLMLFGVLVLRWLGLRMSKDATTLKADASDRRAYDDLNTRIAQMDRRIAELERSRALSLGFAARCMAYISQCDCDDIIPTRDDILADYRLLIDEIAIGATAMEGA